MVSIALGSTVTHAGRTSAAPRLALGSVLQDREVKPVQVLTKSSEPLWSGFFSPPFDYSTINIDEQEDWEQELAERLREARVARRDMVIDLPAISPLGRSALLSSLNMVAPMRPGRKVKMLAIELCVRTFLPGIGCRKTRYVGPSSMWWWKGSLELQINKGRGAWRERRQKQDMQGRRRAGLARRSLRRSAVRIVSQSVAILLSVFLASTVVHAQFVGAPDAYRAAVQRGDIVTANKPAAIELTAERRAELYKINYWANAAITYRSERVDSWTSAVYEGDCEDYVIAKIDALVRRGWPRGALRITYVTTEQGFGHAVLAVTAHSDIVFLDNRFPNPASASDLISAGYAFHAWEVPGNPNVWQWMKGSFLFIAALAKKTS